MAIVKSNTPVGPHIYRLVVSGAEMGTMGQFYMLRCWDTYPILSRPISLHDVDQDGNIIFLFRTEGEGTQLLAQLKPGDSLDVEGPFGTGFPQVDGRVAIVGGGIGSAPLLLTARSLPGSHVFLGYTGEPYELEAFEQCAGKLTVTNKGTIIDHVDPNDFDYILSCGPLIMQRVLYDKVKQTSAQLFVSVEKRMGCGIGACYCCTIPTTGGNRKVCTDGPVFPAQEVDFDALTRI